MVTWHNLADEQPGVGDLIVLVKFDALPSTAVRTWKGMRVEVALGGEKPGVFGPVVGLDYRTDPGLPERPDTQGPVTMWCRP